MNAATDDHAPFAASVEGGRLPKRVSLKQRRLIRKLFDRGNPEVISEAVGCIRILARPLAEDEAPGDERVLVGFAPGRQRGAVERNRIKRLLREAFRLRRQELTGQLPETISALTLMIVFRSSGQTTATIVATDMNQALDRLIRTLKKRPSSAD